MLKNQIISKSFMWMAIGMLASAISGFALLTQPTLLEMIFGNNFVYPAILIFDLLLVIYLSARVFKMSAGAAKSTFVGYSLLNGIVFASIFLVYKLGSVLTIFISTAIMFGLLATYGYYTKTDLTKIGKIAFFGLIGLIISSLINLFLQNSSASYIISGFGVIIFTVLTAYDMQKIKNIQHSMSISTEEDVERIAIISALSLYLDFINLFISLLNIFGDRK
jgi:hypothetical protein